MTDTTTDRAVAIELRNIVKRFPGVVANDGVNLTVRAGTIHAIIGENGSGKSTLMKTLYGAHRPDEGTVIVNGAEQHFRSPRDAIAVGIGMVFQHFQLADNFTVWENIVLGDEPGTPWNLRRRIAIRQLRDLGKRYGLEVDPDALVSDLGVGAEATRRDPQGALPRCQDHHPRRTDGCLGPPRGRRAVRLAARAHRNRSDGDLHLPQARRGAALRRRDHGHQGRQDRRRGAGSFAGRRAPARRADGRQRAALAREPERARSTTDVALQ